MSLRQGAGVRQGAAGDRDVGAARHAAGAAHAHRHPRHRAHQRAGQRGAPRGRGAFHLFEVNSKEFSLCVMIFKIYSTKFHDDIFVFIYNTVDKSWPL